MPYSSNSGKETICQWLDKNKSEIKTMIDFGAGSGAYGKMFKFLAPEITTIAVEAHEPYITRFKLADVYSAVIKGLIQDIEWNDADVAIFGDVIEHFPKDQALAIIEKALAKYRWVILSIPLGHCPQGSSQHNDLEQHLSEWTFEELSAITDWEIKESATEANDGYTIGIFIKK